MGYSVIQIALFMLGACAAGATVAWVVQALRARQQLSDFSSEAHGTIAEISAQRDGFANQANRSQAKVDKLQAANARQRDKLKAAVDKSKLLAKSVLTLRDERENTKVKLTTLHNTLATLKRQSTALQTEFTKTREFYKRELLKTLAKRKELEQEVKEAREEQEEFTKLVEQSTLEHGSEENMVVAAQLRLGQIEVLTRNVSKLEAENEQLRKDAKSLKLEFESRERDLKELDELKLHNRQLVRAVESLENSRKEQESEAQRYRQQADESEKMSDTLRLKLDDLQKNFADIEKQQDKAINEARNATVVPLVRK